MMKIEDGRIATLDGLRGAAAAIVVISHCANEGLLPTFLGGGLGQMGVAAFYILSGFLMSFLYIRRPFGRAEVRRYWVARGARVLPLYVTVVLAAGAVVLLGGPPLYQFATLPGFLGNILLVSGTSVLWSIPVEIHYYAVFVLLWACCAAGRPVAGLAAVAGLQATFAVLVYAATAKTSTLPFWAHFFLFGHLLAMAVHVRRADLERLSRQSWLGWLGWIVLAAFAVAPPEIRRGAGLPVLPNFLDPVTAGYPAAVTVLALLGAGPFRVLASAPLRWLGGISFSVYLLHWPVLMLLPQAIGPLAGIPGLAALLVGVATLGLAELANRYVELPAQRALRRRLS